MATKTPMACTTAPAKALSPMAALGHEVGADSPLMREMVLHLDGQIEATLEALAELAAPEKQFAVVPGATHLFEEPGALEQVSGLAADWFRRHLRRPDRAQAN